MLDLEVRIPLDRTAPSIARHLLDGLKGRVSEQDLERYRIAITEMVTNAVVHQPMGSSRVKLILEISPDQLRASVLQDWPGFEPSKSTPGPDQESGWGLYLVDQVADRWGVEGAEQAEVWAEFALAGGGTNGNLGVEPDPRSRSERAGAPMSKGNAHAPR